MNGRGILERQPWYASLWEKSRNIMFIMFTPHVSKGVDYYLEMFVDKD